MLGQDASVHLVPSEHPFQLGMQTLVTPKWDWASPGRDTVDDRALEMQASASASIHRVSSSMLGSQLPQGAVVQTKV